jgi:hypothetical protein
MPNTWGDGSALDQTLSPELGHAAHPWQSPDIEVQNPRSLANPALWANVPWLGHDNTVVASVTNRGTVPAPGTVASFYVKDYAVGGAPETFIGSDTHDVAPGATVPFTTTWTPPAGDATAPLNYCVIVRIAPCRAPTTLPIPEMTEAQSNYAAFISSTSSPASREITFVTVGNPFDRPTRFYLGAGQTHPFYRTYLEHTWLELDPGETRRVRVMFELATGGALHADEGGAREAGGLTVARQAVLAKYLAVPNTVTLWGSCDDPYDPTLHAATPAIGVTATVATGHRTRIVDFHVDGGTAAGRLVNGSGEPVGEGCVILFTRGAKGRERCETVPVDPGGRFEGRIGDGRAPVGAYYVGDGGAADASIEAALPDACSADVARPPSEDA